MGVKRSGMNSIDALLKGTYWSKKAGKPLVLTYSIDQSGKGKLSSRQDDNEVAMVQEALKQWERVANIDFRQVSKGGNLRFSGQNGGAGKASSKTDWKWWNPGSWGTKKLKQVNITLGKSNASGKGGRLLAQAIHEIGHALGLKHPGNYNGDKQDKSPFLPYSQDNNTNTVMSYNEVGNQEATPMAYDIRAIQYLYGAKTFNSGNTRYRFDSVHGYTNGYYGYQGDKYKRMKLSLWDSAGRDILDFSKLATNSKGYHFDINEGGILTKKDALNSWWYRPRDNSKKGNFDSNKKWTTPYGTTIAYGTAIEDVIGSASHDRIIGNSASNYLKGEKGDDHIDGGAGNDTLSGGAGNDRLYASTGHDTLYGGSGNDFLAGWAGDDRMLGGFGNDRMFGDDGSDYMRGSYGDDIMWGESSR
ncbi:MAG: matrixin family metalloprotease, partial [Cyanobacteria bacterium J06555_13]